MAIFRNPKKHPWYTGGHLNFCGPFTKMHQQSHLPGCLWNAGDGWYYPTRWYCKGLLYGTNSWGVPYIHMFRFPIIWFYGDNFVSHELRILSLNHTGWYIRLMFFWNSWLIWISKRLWDGNQFIIAVHSHCKLKESQQCHRKLLEVVAGVLMQTPIFFLSRT